MVVQALFGRLWVREGEERVIEKLFQNDSYENVGLVGQRQALGSEAFSVRLILELMFLFCKGLGKVNSRMDCFVKMGVSENLSQYLNKKSDAL